MANVLQSTCGILLVSLVFLAEGQSLGALRLVESTLKNAADSILANPQHVRHYLVADEVAEDGTGIAQHGEVTPCIKLIHYTGLHL